MKAKTRTYRVRMREWYQYVITVVSPSEDEAIEKVEAFGVQHRGPETKYQQEGLTAILRDHIVKWGTPETYTSKDQWELEVREWVVYHVKVVATSVAEAMRKVEAFDAQQRKPKAEYRLEGLTVIVDEEEVDSVDLHQVRRLGQKSEPTIRGGRRGAAVKSQPQVQWCSSAGRTAAIEVAS